MAASIAPEEMEAIASPACENSRFWEFAEPSALPPLRPLEKCNVIYIAPCHVSWQRNR